MDTKIEQAKELASKWIERVNATRNVYETWERRFHCRKTYDFYEGHQWEGFGVLNPSGVRDYLPYTLNLFYSTVETRLPALTFSNPVFVLSPKPNKESITYGSPEMFQSIQMRQDALNTLITDPETNFQDILEAAILDAHFRFGIVEIGVAQSWVENPNLDKPVLKSDYEPNTEAGPKDVASEPETPSEAESVYLKYIPASAFRINPGAKGRLSKCDWCGYYEYVRFQDLASQKEFYKYMKDYDSLAFSCAGGGFDNMEELNSVDSHSYDQVMKGDYVKVLHIFDNRLKKRFLINCNTELVIGITDFPGTEQGKPRLPLEDLRFSKSLQYWYGVPPASQWLSPQMDFNEQRENLRSYSRRMKRKYLVRLDAFENSQELDKLTNSQDGTFAAIQGFNPSEVIAPVPIVPIAPETLQSLQASQRDFDIASGVTSDQRGLAADRQTATQAKIIDQRTTIRESRSANTVANFLCRIGRQISLCQESLDEPFWIQVGTGIGAANPQASYQIISSVDFGQFDFMVNVQIETISPLANEMRKNAFLEFLAVINQYPQFGLSTTLVQEIADKLGYRNSQVIAEFQQLALAQQMGMQQQMELAQRTTAAATDPAGEQIQNELNNGAMPTEGVA